MHRFRYTLCGCAAFAAFAFDTGAAHAASPRNTRLRAGSSSSGLEEIVVTARKRAEKAQSTPVFLTAFSAKSLQQQNVTSIADLQYHTPGLQLQTGVDPATIYFSIRGQNTLDSSINLDPAIGIYVDGVYVGQTAGDAAAGNLDDVDGVEVLEGPQGTLYGRNTTGGAVNIHHVVPDYHLNGWVKVETGNYGLANVAGAATVPLYDQLATMRLYARYYRNNPYGHSVSNGTPYDNQEDYDILDTIRVNPTDRLQVIVRGGYDSQRAGSIVFRPVYDLPGYTDANAQIVAQAFKQPQLAGAALGCAQHNPLIPTAYCDNVVFPAAAPLFAQAPGLFTATPSKFYDNYTNDLRAYSVNKLVQGSITADYNFASWLQIKTITALRNDNFERSESFGGSAYSVLPTYSQPLGIHYLTQEIDASGAALNNRLKYTAGFYYYYSTGHDVAISQAVPAINPYLSFADSVLRAKSLAPYGQVTYSVTPSISLTGGIRYTSERKELVARDRLDPVAGGPSICEEAVAVGAPCSATFKDSFTNISYLGSVDYVPFPNTLLYAKISKGFKSGGEQERSGGAAAGPFRPETVIDYEVGAKADFFDHRARINFALYHDDYTNFQKTFLIIFDGGLTNIVQNAGKAKIDGAEYQLTARPFDALTLSAGGAYTYPHYTRFYDPTQIIFGLDPDRRGEKFQNVPKWTWTFSGDYNVPIQNLGSVDLEADYFRTTDVPLQTAPTYAPAFADVQKAYGLLDAQATLHIDSRNLDIALWGKNITNVHYYSSGLDVTPTLGFVTNWTGTPRTYGIRAIYHF